MTEIMVVDDSKFERKKMSDMLKDEGYDVMGAKNGKKAVQKYRDQRPDLVLMDIVMDKLDGIDALKKILKTDEDANVVMVSGVGHEETVSKAMEIGAERYIIKPALRSKVVPTVNQVLGD
jgi:two-component system chemotaxis response regulator CheY